MNTVKKTLSLVLSLLLVVGMLSACQKQTGGDDVSTPGSSSQDPGSSSSTPREIDLDAITDICKYAAGLDAGTVVATVDGEDITIEEVLYWVTSDCDDLSSFYYYTQGLLELPWDSTVTEDQALDSYIMQDALQGAALYHLVDRQAGSEGVTASQEDLNAIETALNNLKADQDNSDEQLKRYLWQSALTAELYRWYCECEYLYTGLTNLYFGEGTEGYPSDSAVLQYLEDSGMYFVKHILLSTVDTTTREPLDEATVAEKKAKAESLLAQLRASSDPSALFDQLMKENSEDPGLETNPDGYLASPGQMYAEFEEASLALKEGEISDIVETDVGYHIILRLPLNVDPADYREEYTSELMVQLRRGWLDAADLQTTEAFSSLSAQSIYQAISDYRDAMAAQQPES